MKFRFKKMVCLCAAAVLTLSLTACGGDTNTGETGSDEATSADTQEKSESGTAASDTSLF